jgi:hypothetical protein
MKANYKKEKEKIELKNEKRLFNLNKEIIILNNFKISSYIIYQIKIKRIMLIIFILTELISSISTSGLTKNYFYNKRIMEEGADPNVESGDSALEVSEPEVTERVKRPQEIIIKVSKNGEQELLWKKFDNYSNNVLFSFYDENDNILESDGFKVNVIHQKQ